MNRFPVVFITLLLCINAYGQVKPQVFVLTDINLVGGDPDDRQSLIHLLWYSDELDIVGIVPDYWTGKGYEACLMGLDAYEQDFEDYAFGTRGFIPPSVIRNNIMKSENEAIEKLRELAMNSNDPLYVLVWGSMTTLKNALFSYPEIADNIRVLTIGTGVKYGPKDEVAGEKCDVVNWNGKGRNEIFYDPRFKKMWWVESNWTYNGMFEGEGPKMMFQKLSKYGAMGRQIKDVTKNHDWAQYFRVGDTPTVTYLIDPGHNVNDPESSSWAGRFKRPFPEERPYYFTDDNGPIVWNYADPCQTWHNKTDMYQHNKSTLINQRADMYDQLLTKLNRIYAP